MSCSAIVKIGNEILRNKVNPVDMKEIQGGQFKTLLADMVDTMRATNGVGLAANQIGWDRQIFTMECQRNHRYPDQKEIDLQIYLNPVITASSEETEEEWEGCLSVPKFRGIVPRAQKITFEAFTPEGQKIKKTVSGFEARIVQHEVDHLNGLVYLNRMVNLSTLMYIDEFNKIFGQDIKEAD